jgi:hypothetical protein
MPPASKPPVPPEAPGPTESEEPKPSEPTESPASSDHRGVGQSGYAAGRRDPDRALGRHLQPRNANYPPKTDDEPRHDELHTDDRFTGRGGSERPPPPRSDRK